MNKSRLRFSTQEKSVILGEAHLIGLEPTLQKYHLTVETLFGWQKKFKGSKASNVTAVVEGARKKTKATKTKPETPGINETEDALLRLVASLIVQCVLDEDMPNR